MGRTGLEEGEILPPTFVGVRMTEEKGRQYTWSLSSLGLLSSLSLLSFA